MSGMSAADQMMLATERVTTTRAAHGADLWMAIEAAQYARVILCSEPRSEDGKAALAEFMDTFTRQLDTWEETSPAGQSTMLETVGRGIEDLKQSGLHVHWAVTERTMKEETDGEERFPLAVLVVDDTDAIEMLVDIPLDLDVDEDDTT